MNSRQDMGSGNLLEVRDLEIEVMRGRSAGRKLIDGVSFTLGPGEVVGLIGESGAGKSTLGLAAIGYIRPGCKVVGGSITFAGAAIHTLPPVEVEKFRRHNVAYVAQSAAASFNPAIPLGRQVCEIARNRPAAVAGESESQAIALYREFSLPEAESFGRRYVHQASGGQLQRAMTAMALMQSPNLIVFDEPTSALDVTTQVDVLAALRKAVRDRGVAAIYVSHDLAVVAQVADRVIVLRDGRVVESGPTAQVLRQPRHEYTKRLIAERGTSYRRLTHEKKDRVPLLSIKNATASYHSLPNVIDNVNLDVHRGETVAIVGESGSGKSTLARMVAGLLRPQSGTIAFDERILPDDYRKRDRDTLRRIQLIYQLPDIALNPKQTVLQVIGRPLQFYLGLSGREIRTEVLELLRLTELDASLIDRPSRDLSGGQKQRVCVARALAAKPDLVICDEITAPLDPLVGEEMLRLLRRLQEQLGMAYMFISHDLGIVRRLADRVAVMQKGRIVASGAPTEVFETGRHPYVEQLLSSVPEMRPDWLDDVLNRRSAGR